jgi:two-component system cell cycle response regulator
MRVLIAEDDPVERLKLKKILKGDGFEVISVTDGAEAWAELQLPDAPTLAILDWIMPKMDGVDICRSLRQQGGRYTYVIRSTSRGSAEDVVEGIQAGVDDYLVKPLIAEDLRTCLANARRVLDLHEQLALARGHVNGLLGSEAVLRRWQGEVQRRGRAGTEMGRLLVKLNSPAQADEMARQIQRFLRDGDTVGRHSDDELIVILPGCGEETTAIVAERLRGVTKLNVQLLEAATLQPK